MYVPSGFHIRLYYSLKSHRHNNDTPIYTEEISGEYVEEQYKAMDEEIRILIRNDTQEVFTRRQASFQNLLPGKVSFKCKRKPNCNISKTKAQFL